MSPLLVTILSSLLHGAAPSAALATRADAAEKAVHAAVLAESPPALRDRDTKIMLVFGYRESGFTSPPADAGRHPQCGVVQVKADLWSHVLGAWDCAALRGDMVIGFRSGLRVLHAYEKQYGFVGALNAYVTGRGERRTHLAYNRCVDAGLGNLCGAEP